MHAKLQFLACEELKHLYPLIPLTVQILKPIILRQKSDKIIIFLFVSIHWKAKAVADREIIHKHISVSYKVRQTVALRNIKYNNSNATYICTQIQTVLNRLVF